MDNFSGWAKKRGFYTAKAARLDSYRAANHLLRMALDGKICVCLYPPGYSSKKGMEVQQHEFFDFSVLLLPCFLLMNLFPFILLETWATHPEIEIVRWIQARESDRSAAIHIDVSSDDDDDIQAASHDQVTRADEEEEEGDDADDSSSASTSEDEGSSAQAGNKFAALSVGDD